MPKANGITRQEILNSIKCHGAMTAETLARELGISQVAVRQHLASLDAEGIIMVSVERRGLGRPSHRYMLTPRGDETFPRRYDTLANALLDTLRDWQGEEAVQQLLTLRQKRLQADLMSRFKDRPLAARVNELVRMLNDRGFMAEALETSDGAFHLTKRNCALLSVACNYPGVCCQSEADLYQDLLGDVEVQRDQFILDGDYSCAFCIRARAMAARDSESDR